LASVPSWGRDKPTLHWFGLTSGWYWMHGRGSSEFLRYSDEAVRRWELERPHPDYYVVRLWEDLIVLRGALQVSVPDDLVPFVDGTFERREFPDRDDFGADVDAAFTFQDDHNLYMGYLTDAPVMTCWRHTAGGSDMVTLSQTILPQQQGTFEGPDRLDAVIPAAEFFAAIEDFDHRLIAAMETRVSRLERDGPSPGIDLDIRQLRTEHTQRSTWLAQRLAAPRMVDWAKVRAGVAEISSWPPRDDDRSS
jgi:hypothetical protein